jgi:hypothetical protein
LAHKAKTHVPQGLCLYAQRSAGVLSGHCEGNDNQSFNQSDSASVGANLIGVVLFS